MFRVVCLPMSYRRRKTVIHQYINNGYYIVLDVNSGSVHSVDPLLYDVISFLSRADSGQREAVSDCPVPERRDGGSIKREIQPGRDQRGV